MSRFELGRSIEVTKLNKRTGIPTTDPPVTIPYGAIIENRERDRDFEKFTYLGELFRCPHDVLEVAGTPAAAPAAHAEPTGGGPEPARLLWETLKSNQPTSRAKVPGGWLVSVGAAGSAALTFYPDPDHQWDGTSLP